MKSILKKLPKVLLAPYQEGQNGPFGMEVCAATAAETPLGAIYSCKNSQNKWYEAVPYDDPDIRRFDDPYAAQRHIENIKLGDKNNEIEAG